jgi:hypothetical protein
MGTVSLFLRTPPSICVSNNRSAVNHSEFVVEAIHDLLIKVMIEECESKPIVVKILKTNIFPEVVMFFFQSASYYDVCLFLFVLVIIMCKVTNFTKIKRHR